MLTKLACGILFAITCASVWASGPCELRDVDVKLARFYDEQNLKMYWKVVGEIMNKCQYATGVHVRFTGYDAKGNLVNVRELWPASIRNIPANSRSPFALTVFPYDPTIKKIQAEVIEVTQWKN